MDKLAPGKVAPQSTDQAFQYLAKASRFEQDSHLCDSIASQVYSAWLARKSNDRLNAASKSLEDERKRLGVERADHRRGHQARERRRFQIEGWRVRTLSSSSSN